MRNASKLDPLIQCKIEGICTRDKIVSEWLQDRVDSNKLIRMSALAKLRLEWGLDCPPICPQPLGD
jgi:hypothetical protein